jgi:ATP-binding protein involved in chromosome partitioning
VKYRAYAELAGEDRSRLAGQIAEQRRRLDARLATVRRVVAVASGKGGVGKSHVTALLARAAAVRLPDAVGVLDADLRGPTVARMLGASGPVRVDDAGVHPAGGDRGIRVFSTDLLLPEDGPLRWREPEHGRHLWRGALDAAALREFLADVAWGRLELLLVDLAPGADRLEDLLELVPALAGVVFVTLPSEESRRAVARAMRVALAGAAPVLGVVENMSGSVCACCGARGPLFPGDAGARLAAEFDRPLLARLPFRADGHDAAELAVLADALMGVLP